MEDRTADLIPSDAVSRYAIVAHHQVQLGLQMSLKNDPAAISETLTDDDIGSVYFAGAGSDGSSLRVLQINNEACQRGPPPPF